MMLKTVAASMCLAALTHVSPTTTFDASGLIYEATHELNLTPVATQLGDRVTNDVRGPSLKLNKGDAVILEDTKVDAHGTSLTRLAVEDADEDAPSTYWVRTVDLNNADLKMIVQTGEHLFTPIPGLTNPPDPDYVTTLEASRRWGRARRGRGGNYCISHPTSPRCCKSAVNYLLLRMHKLKTRVNGRAATSMARGLALQNWREVGCPARARPTRGMTCTYRGGGNGHTEAWNGHCWYYGAKCSRTPMSQPNRQCFSCKEPRGG